MSCTTAPPGALCWEVPPKAALDKFCSIKLCIRFFVFPQGNENVYDRLYELAKSKRQNNEYSLVENFRPEDEN